MIRFLARRLSNRSRSLHIAPRRIASLVSTRRRSARRRVAIAAIQRREKRIEKRITTMLNLLSKVIKVVSRAITAITSITATATIITNPSKSKQ